MSSATFAQLNKQVLLTRGLKFRPGDPLHVKTFDDIADEEVPTFFIEMVRTLRSRTLQPLFFNLLEREPQPKVRSGAGVTNIRQIG